jgi:hypothetical protein
MDLVDRKECSFLKKRTKKLLFYVEPIGTQESMLGAGATLCFYFSAARLNVIK